MMISTPIKNVKLDQLDFLIKHFNKGLSYEYILEYFQKLKETAKGVDDSIDMQILIVLSLIKQGYDNKKVAME